MTKVKTKKKLTVKYSTLTETLVKCLVCVLSVAPGFTNEHTLVDFVCAPKVMDGFHDAFCC